MVFKLRYLCSLLAVSIFLLEPQAFCGTNNLDGTSSLDPVFNSNDVVLTIYGDTARGLFEKLDSITSLPGSGDMKQGKSLFCRKFLAPDNTTYMFDCSIRLNSMGEASPFR